MATALLDVNLLLALSWPNHVHHDAAHEWFRVRHSDGWATCPWTEAGFVRLSCQPAVVKTTVTVSEALRILELNISAPEHVFWPLDHSIIQLPPEIRDRVMGHRQLSDALLLDLAIRRGGKLATLDGRVESLLPPTSDHRAALEILSVG